MFEHVGFKAANRPAGETWLRRVPRALKELNMSELHISDGEAGRFVCGFTLIELMITVAIVTILAMIAIPAYQAQLVKGRRSAAESTLLDIAQREQQYLLDQRSYAATVTALGTSIPVSVIPYYVVAIAPTVGPPPAFIATATPIPGTAQASDYTLTIDNTGAKTPAGTW